MADSDVILLRHRGQRTRNEQAKDSNTVQPQLHAKNTRKGERRELIP